MLAVHPVTDERFPGRSFALRDLVLVMRKDEIDGAGVDVERLAEELHRHRGALEMPAGTTFAERCLPRRLVFLLRFPEDEIARRLLLVLVVFDAAVFAAAIDLHLRELAVL